MKFSIKKQAAAQVSYSQKGEWEKKEEDSDWLL